MQPRQQHYPLRFAHSLYIRMVDPGGTSQYGIPAQHSFYFKGSQTCSQSPVKESQLRCLWSACFPISFSRCSVCQLQTKLLLLKKKPSESRGFKRWKSLRTVAAHVLLNQQQDHGDRCNTDTNPLTPDFKDVVSEVVPHRWPWPRGRLEILQICSACRGDDFVQARRQHNPTPLAYSAFCKLLNSERTSKYGVITRNSVSVERLQTSTGSPIHWSQVSCLRPVCMLFGPHDAGKSGLESDPEWNNKAHEMPKSNNGAPTKFPPRPPSSSQIEQIVNDFCADTSPSAFEESGCAVCGELKLHTDLTPIQDIGCDLLHLSGPLLPPLRSYRCIMDIMTYKVKNKYCFALNIF